MVTHSLINVIQRMWRRYKDGIRAGGALKKSRKGLSFGEPSGPDSPNHGSNDCGIGLMPTLLFAALS